jgi:hypothetical protein
VFLKQINQGLALIFERLAKGAVDGLKPYCPEFLDYKKLQNLTQKEYVTITKETVITVSFVSNIYGIT